MQDRQVADTALAFGWRSVSALAVSAALLVAVVLQADGAAGPLLGTAAIVGCVAEGVGCLAAGLVRRRKRSVATWLVWLVVVVCVYWTLLPPLDLRWSLGVAGNPSALVTALWASGIHALCRYSLDQTAHPRERPSLGIAALAGAVALAVCGAVATGSVVQWAAPPTIELFLLSRTPLGSPQSTVRASLSGVGLASRVGGSRAYPGNQYPPAEVGGATWERALVGEHRLVFATSVEAYFYFDDAGRLAEIRVRKTVDSL
jgi:hypothetical protein